MLLITTGNIVNKDLLALFERNFKTAIKLFNSYSVVEISNHFVLGHKP
jgi:predicted nuclease of predicted toxin-antitoxin system